VGSGELYCARIFANSINREVLGSLEHATVIGGAKLIVVMPDTLCGPITRHGPTTVESWRSVMLVSEILSGLGCGLSGMSFPLHS